MRWISVDGLLPRHQGAEVNHGIWPRALASLRPRLGDSPRLLDVHPAGVLVSFASVHPLPVHIVSANYDVLDYVAAVGGLVGGLAALVALWLARLSKGVAEQSATDAKRSADAAAEQLQLMRDELNRKAAPVIDLRLTSEKENPTGRDLVLEVLVGNEGNRQADLVPTVVTIPESVKVTVVIDEQGTAVDETATNALKRHRHPALGLSIYWNADVGPISRGTAQGRYLGLIAPMGEYMILGQVSHDDLDTGPRIGEWRLTVDANGASLTCSRRFAFDR